MTTRNLPDSSDAARHGTGDADLTIMLAAHAAFRRDLAQLARAAAFADLPDPGRRASVQAGWELFKRQLHLHHTAEDAIVWPALRERLPAATTRSRCSTRWRPSTSRSTRCWPPSTTPSPAPRTGTGPTRARSATPPTPSPRR